MGLIDKLLAISHSRQVSLLETLVNTVTPNTPTSPWLPLTAASSTAETLAAVHCDQFHPQRCDARHSPFDRRGDVVQLQIEKKQAHRHYQSPI